MSNLFQKLRNHITSSSLGASRGIACPFLNIRDSLSIPSEDKTESYLVGTSSKADLDSYQKTYERARTFGRAVGIIPLALSVVPLFDRGNNPLDLFIPISLILTYVVTTSAYKDRDALSSQSF